MKDRILAFLQSENKSYAQFADEIGVQPSGISHILSGRNNPSLDFVIKMLHRYSSLSAEWLLFGHGPMYKSVSQPTLFDTGVTEIQAGSDDGQHARGYLPGDLTGPETSPADTGEMLPPDREDVSSGKKLSRIVMFYSDKSFTEYTPS